MRQPRLKLPDQSAVYHCISRCVGGQFLLEDHDKEQLRLMLWQQAEFCGIEVITYAILDNHFHVQVRTPQPGEIPDAELLRRAGLLYPEKDPFLRMLRREFQQEGALSSRPRRRLLRRMGDVSWFMKELKQRFSRSYNQRHERFGTLWAERFRSLLIEDDEEAVRTVAAYIDLNAVRAGLVTDPKDYRFCGYAEAVAGSEMARAGLLGAVGHGSWDGGGGAAYRELLFVSGGSAGESGKAVLEREAILKVVHEGGEIGIGEALRVRVRHFSDGLVLGTEGYVNGIFLRFRDRFGVKRRTGARKLKGLPFDRLRVMRDLRVDPVS